MLKRLGDWLDSFTDFAFDHPCFVVGVPTVIAVVAFITVICFAVAGADMTPEINWEGSITLEDTRQVHCIRFTDGSMSCDWTHVDGSDNL